MPDTPHLTTAASLAADKRRHGLRAPGAFHILLEGRAPVELISLFAAWPFLRRLPHGDGRTVLVFPGMGASDATTVPLRRIVQRLGYTTHAWGQGFNLGPRPGVIERAGAA